MLNHPEFQKTFNFNGVLIIVFNALVFDLLLIGYGGHSDISKIGELVSNVTVGVLFESALIFSLVFVFYTAVFKEPLIWILSKIYFIVVLLRVLTYPFWRVGFYHGFPKQPVRIAYANWKENCRFQLVEVRGSAKWTPMQHLSVATFFVFMLSVISPWFGFQSLGYRLLPEIQNTVGIPLSFHWFGWAAFSIAIFFLCSNSMLATFGGQKQSYQLYRNRLNSSKLVEHIDWLIACHDDLSKEILLILPSSSAKDKLKSELEKIDTNFHELRSLVTDNFEADHKEVWLTLKSISDAISENSG